jgi:hypothetical protein
LSSSILEEEAAVCDEDAIIMTDINKDEVS